MRKSLILVASLASIIVADVAGAQPRPYNEAWRPQGQPSQPSFNPQGHERGRGHDNDARRGDQFAQTYYYNGRWVGPDEWQRRSNERDRWAQNYQRRHGGRDRKDDNDSSALIAGIIGFALGAAIVGSQQQAEHARTADQSWDSYCAKKYRSYDRRSRTYMSTDGVRRYCQ